MVRIQTHYNQRKAPHRQTECDSNCDRFSCTWCQAQGHGSSGTDGESEETGSEGSLADFIEHDSDELDAAQGDESYNEDDAENDEDEDDADDDAEQKEEDETEEDPDVAISAQYTTEMERLGTVITQEGVRRSTRSTKGRAPTRYVDEEYAELMLEDLTAEDRDQLAEEFTTSSTEQWEDNEDEDDDDELE